LYGIGPGSHYGSYGGLHIFNALQKAIFVKKTMVYGYIKAMAAVGIE
jgi:hypothetical protein